MILAVTHPGAGYLFAACALAIIGGLCLLASGGGGPKNPI